MYMEKWREVKCNGQRIRVVKYGQKKQSCLRKFAGWNFFHGSPTRIVETKNKTKKKQNQKQEDRKQKKLQLENLMRFNDIVCQFALYTFNLFDRVVDFSWLFIWI